MALRPQLVSLIIPVKNDGGHVLATLESALNARTAYPREVIVVDDGSSDGCCDFLKTYRPAAVERLEWVCTYGIGTAKAKNLGAGQALGEYLIFCDAGFRFGDDWIDMLLEPIRGGFADGASPAVVSAASPNEMKFGQSLDGHLCVQWNEGGGAEEAVATAVLPGCCFAIPQKTFHMLGGFDGGFRAWGYEDVDFSLKMWLCGYTCMIQPKVTIVHMSDGKLPRPAQPDQAAFNLLRLAYSHFSRHRIKSCKKLIPRDERDRIEAQVLESGAEHQRERYKHRRIHDDDWYMDKFGIPF